MRFSRKTGTPSPQAALQQTHQIVDDKLAECLPLVPEYMPDGSAFAGREMVQRLSLMCKWALAQNADKMVDLAKICLHNMALYATLGSPEAQNRAGHKLEILYGGQILTDAGLPELQRELDTCVFPLYAYQQAAGMPLMNDVES